MFKIEYRLISSIINTYGSSLSSGCFELARKESGRNDEERQEAA